MTTIHAGVGAFGVQCKELRGVFAESGALPPGLSRVQGAVSRFAQRHGVGLDAQPSEVAHRIAASLTSRVNAPSARPVMDAGGPGLG